MNRTTLLAVVLLAAGCREQPVHLPPDLPRVPNNVPALAPKREQPVPAVADYLSVEQVCAEFEACDRNPARGKPFGGRRIKVRGRVDHVQYFGGGSDGVARYGLHLDGRIICNYLSREDAADLSPGQTVTVEGVAVGTWVYPGADWELFNARVITETP